MSRKNYAALEAGWIPGDLGAFTHAGDRKVKLYDSGGGSAQPTSTSQTTIPEYAQPYMERLLGKAEAASEAPYQTYGGERLAQATPEQEAARSEVSRLQTPGQFGTGTGLAALGGLSSIGYGGQAAGLGQQYMGMATDPRAQQAFMSPYMQNVVDVQKQQAIRDAQQGQLAQNLGAARQGSYGGARQLLAQTERERNLGQQMAQIQAAGSQRAFEAAQQAQQFGSTLGLQGLQAGISASGQGIQAGQTLGQLGAQRQQSDLARLQAQEQTAALTQRDRQASLDLAYQDFLAQQRQPYSQLGFMSDILRGSGNLAATGGRAIYEAPPSTGSQLLGLAGTLGGAYLAGGAPKLFREGGEVGGLGAIKNYAEGGEVIQDMVDVAKLTPQQIEQTQKTNARPDVSDIILLAELDKKLAELKRLQTGQAVPPQATAVEKIRQESMNMAGLPAIPVDENYYMPEEEALASGGIVAFAGGGMSMDPGMPYGLGYTNNMGYESGGIVAFQDGGESMFGMTPMGEGPVRGLSEIIDIDPMALRGPRRLQVYPFMTEEEQVQFGQTGNIPSAAAERFRASRQPAATAAAPKPAPAPAPAPAQRPQARQTAKAESKPRGEEPMVAVSSQVEQKINKAEDKYEKYLTKLMDEAGMEEADQRKAIGFALMKAGSKAMQGKSRYASENIGAGIEAGVDEYTRYLNQASKNKKEAMKTLVEYGLAKERMDIQREEVGVRRAGLDIQREEVGVRRANVAAQERATAESAALRREAQQEALQQKYFETYQDRYKNIPQFKKDGTPNPGWKSFGQFMREAQAARGPETSITTPGERPSLSSFRG
jgi:hypothetical protein